MRFNDELTELLKMCRVCYMCRHACPVFLATKLDSHTPRGYAVNLSKINEGQMEWEDIDKERLFHCSQCGLGRQICEMEHFDEARMVLLGRQEMIKSGEEPDKIKQAARAIREKRQIANTVISENILDQKDCDVLYLAGTALLNENDSILKSAEKLFSEIGERFTMLSHEDISGMLLYELGYWEEARKWAEDLIKTIAKLNPKRVVTSCAHLYDMVKNQFKYLGVEEPLNITFILEYLDENERDLAIATKPIKETVAYHDPCHIGRENGIFDVPRRLIAKRSGREVFELFHAREEAECCGAGAVVNEVFPEVASKVAENRLRQLQKSGVDKLVTACPNCWKLFSQVCKKNGYSLQVVDILEYILS